MNSSAGYWSGGRRSRRGMLGYLGAAAAGGALAACGGGNNKSSNGSVPATRLATRAATAVATSVPTPVAIASAAPSTAAGSPIAAGGSPTAGAAVAATPVANPSYKTGGTIQYAFVVANPPLDPYEHSTYAAQLLSGFAYSRLFKFNTGADPTIALSHQPVGDLVTGYEVTPDGLTYTMKLQANALFHPPLNRPLTSADVTASWQRFTTDQKNVNSGVYAPIVDALSAPNAGTLVFKLKAPYAPFLNKLASSQYFWVMSQDAAAGKIDPSQQLIGTGPWIYDAQSPTAVNFKKNPNYYVKGIPYADGVVMNIIPDTSTQEAQFAAGKLDTIGVSVADVASLQKQVPKAQAIQYTGNALQMLFFSNVSDPNSAFHDPRMRQAASLGLDRDALLQVAASGKGAWSNLINSGMGKWYLDPKSAQQGDSATWFKHDPAQAKQLLQTAGHANTQFKFIYPNNAYGDVYNAMADAARGMLSAAGFQLSVVTVDYLKDYNNNGQGIFFKGAPADSIVFAYENTFSDPDDYLFNMLSPQGARNHESVNDLDITKLIQQEQQELDDNKRLQLVYQIQQLQDAQMYYPPTVNGAGFILNQPWVQGYFVDDGYGYGTETLAYLTLNK